MIQISSVSALWSVQRPVIMLNIMHSSAVSHSAQLHYDRDMKRKGITVHHAPVHFLRWQFASMFLHFKCVHQQTRRQVFDFFYSLVDLVKLHSLHYIILQGNQNVSMYSYSFTNSHTEVWHLIITPFDQRVAPHLHEIHLTSLNTWATNCHMRIFKTYYLTPLWPALPFVFFTFPQATDWSPYQ